MPNFDGTGPVGKGRGAGRGFGNCVESRGGFRKRASEDFNDLQERVDKLENQLEKVKKHLNI